MLDLVGNPEDRISHFEAHMVAGSNLFLYVQGKLEKFITVLVLWHAIIFFLILLGPLMHMF